MNFPLRVRTPLLHSPVIVGSGRPGFLADGILRRPDLSNNT